METPVKELIELASKAQNLGLLSDWERHFLADIKCKDLTKLSTKQKAVLFRLGKKQPSEPKPATTQAAKSETVVELTDTQKAAKVHAALDRIREAVKEIATLVEMNSDIYFVPNDQAPRYAPLTPEQIKYIEDNDFDVTVARNIGGTLVFRMPNR